LSVGRILEAHINSLHLVSRFGSAGMRHDVNAAAARGCLYALWVTDPPCGGLTMRRVADRIVLSGAKQFYSGAGSAGVELVTAHDQFDQRWMLVFRLGIGEKIEPLPSPLSEMRAAVTGTVDFSGCEVPAEALLGQPGDYLREPDFSTGFWALDEPPMSSFV
jgi:alkylation response protein AidB-like acyl-CoA dehydrogenase